MRRLKQLLLAILVIVVGMQFVRPARNRSGQESKADISNTVSIPNNVHMLFKNACFDCHSNNTSYPWYFNIQPIGWILARDIEAGKTKFNFSEFGSLSSRRQISRLQEVENRIKDGTMPVPAYQLMHPGARLTEEERLLLIDWIQDTKDTIGSQR